MNQVEINALIRSAGIQVAAGRLEQALAIYDQLNELGHSTVETVCFVNNF